MKKLLLSVVTSLIVRSGYSAEILPSIIKDYYAVKNSLVIGEYNAANATAKQLLANINSSDLESSDKTKLLQLLRAFTAASNINDQRKLFTDISDIVVRSAKQKNIKGVNVFFCPMKKAYWLGENESVRNPYYGNAMLTCGKLVETIK